MRKKHTYMCTHKHKHTHTYKEDDLSPLDSLTLNSCQTDHRNRNYTDTFKEEQRERQQERDRERLNVTGSRYFGFYLAQANQKALQALSKLHTYTLTEHTQWQLLIKEPCIAYSDLVTPPLDCIGPKCNLSLQYGDLSQ